MANQRVAGLFSKGGEQPAAEDEPPKGSEQPAAQGAAPQGPAPDAAAQEAAPHELAPSSEARGSVAEARGSAAEAESSADVFVPSAAEAVEAGVDVRAAMPQTPSLPLVEIAVPVAASPQASKDELRCPQSCQRPTTSGSTQQGDANTQPPRADRSDQAAAALVCSSVELPDAEEGEIGVDRRETSGLQIDRLEQSLMQSTLGRQSNHSSRPSSRRSSRPSSRASSHPSSRASSRASSPRRAGDVESRPQSSRASEAQSRCSSRASLLGPDEDPARSPMTGADTLNKSRTMNASMRSMTRGSYDDDEFDAEDASVVKSDDGSSSGDEN